MSDTIEREKGRAYVRRVKTSGDALAVLGVDVNKPEVVVQAEVVRDALRLVDFFYSMEALVRLPAVVFSEYTPDGNREYNRGEVITIGAAKYLLQNWGKIDPNNPPPTNSLCKLFRDGGRYEWVKEEYCLQGFERYYDDGDPVRTGWYRVISARVDSGTPPPNDSQNWLKFE